MPAIDPRDSRTTAVPWGIAGIVCAVLFAWWQLSHRKAEEEPPPQYHTMLELVKIGELPLERLRFVAVDVPPNAQNPNDAAVSIHAIDDGNRTHSVWVGEEIPGTKFTIKSFRQGEGAGDGEAGSPAVTIISRESGAEVVLPFKATVNVAGLCGIFHYRWVPPGGQAVPDFPKGVGETFTLPPENGKKYRVLEIRGRGAVIELPDGTKKLLTVSL